MADERDPLVGDFAADAETIVQAHPDATWQRNYLGVTHPTSPEVTADLTTAANGGADVILYVGHGNSVVLGSNAPHILDLDSVKTWAGNIVLLQATCNANWMAKNETGFRSLAMQALLQPQGGISASIGTSAYCDPDSAADFMQELLRNASKPDALWGSVLLKTQQWAFQSGGHFAEMSRTEQIFGDPAMGVFRKSVNLTPTSTSKFSPTPITGTFKHAPARRASSHVTTFVKNSLDEIR